jgi:hypothetical protein
LSKNHAYPIPNYLIGSTSVISGFLFYILILFFELIRDFVTMVQ